MMDKNQEKGNKDKSETNTKSSNYSFKKEIQIGVLAIVAGLGFFKVVDLRSFIDVIAQLISNDLNKSNHDISVYIFSFVSALAYLFYFFSFGGALWSFFQDGKNFIKAIFISLCSYFIMYFFLVILIFKGPYKNSNESINIRSNNIPKDSVIILQKDNFKNTADTTSQD